MTPVDLQIRQAALNLKNEAAAEELGVPVGTYRHWTMGDRRIPRMLIVLILALAFIRGRGLWPEWMAFRMGKDGASADPGAEQKDQIP
jgi:hypothetical protein